MIFLELFIFLINLLFLFVLILGLSESNSHYTLPYFLNSNPLQIFFFTIPRGYKQHDEDANMSTIHSVLNENLLRQICSLTSEIISVLLSLILWLINILIIPYTIYYYQIPSLAFFFSACRYPLLDVGLFHQWKELAVSHHASQTDWWLRIRL